VLAVGDAEVSPHTMPCGASGSAGSNRCRHHRRYPSEPNAPEQPHSKCARSAGTEVVSGWYCHRDHAVAVGLDIIREGAGFDVRLHGNTNR